MIGAFENIKTQTGYPVKNETMSALIRSIVISIPDFVFASETTFKDRDQWITDIKAESLFPIIDIKESNDNSEKTEYITSEIDYEYTGKPGKYIYLFKTTYKKEYHDYIEAWSGQDMRVFLCDVNRKVIANLNGTDVRGLDVELFHVEKKQIGDKGPSYTQIRLVLSDPSEYNLQTLMDWNPNRFNLNFVTLSSISGSGNTVDFTIKDAVYGIEICNLYFDDITITDDAGGITVLMLTEIGCGMYRITASGSLTYGTINVDSDRFYGSGEYFIVEDTVTLDNFAWESESKFQVDVKYAGSGTLYGGLLQGDFSIVDDIAGTATITAFTEVSTGRYEITVTETLLEGDISIDDGTVTGTTPYLIYIDVEIYDIVISETDEVTLKVRESVSLAAVTGLSASDFSFVDTYNGTFAGLTESESPAGTYELTTDGSLVSGSVEIDTSLYEGSDAYLNSLPTIQNAGAISEGATDWLNPTGGVAERFNAINGSLGSFDVTTSFPVIFTGNAQKIIKSVSTAGFIGIDGLLTKFKTGVDYKLKFKYFIQSLPGYEHFGNFSVNYYIYGTGETPVYLNNFDVPASTPMVAAEYFESETFQITSGENAIYVSVRIQIAFVALWIDEVQLIEV